MEEPKSTSELKINEETCYEILYFSKLYQLLNVSGLIYYIKWQQENEDIKHVFDDLLKTFDLNEASTLADK